MMKRNCVLFLTRESLKKFLGKTWEMNSPDIFSESPVVMTSKDSL